VSTKSGSDEKPAAKAAPKGLKYTGAGFLPGVPARDLTADDVKAAELNRAALIKSGLYTEE